MPKKTRSGPLRLLLDTNVVVAGLLWNGPPRRLIEYAIGGTSVELFSSPELIEELRQTLGYPKFAARIELAGTSVQSLVETYRDIVSLASPKIVPRIVMNDADDDHVIAAALAAETDFIVTGDRRHLLPLGSCQGIGIVNVRDIITRIDSPLVSP
jgi:putative PIN family toxin of toxin-antitoxin system